ncbi:MAG: sterol desaturase family protein [Cyclobacteriaceae bacterium]|nr:MAG: sterol desaturase family protein [Cyclobacteriaceae bacterium]
MSLITILVCALITVATFLFWEFVAWFTHKYIMHGVLWVWHKSHHTVHDHTLEKNDWFAVVFSLPSIALFWYSSTTSNPYLFAVALGILCYGLFYLIFHDVIVHQRIKWRPAKRSKYLQRMIHAHYVHHAKHTKEGCEAFGFLYAPKKYEPKNFVFKKERQATQ